MPDEVGWYRGRIKLPSLFWDGRFFMLMTPVAAERNGGNQMKQKLEAIKTEALAALEQVADLKALDEIRVRFLGKKGALTAILKQMGQFSPDERKTVGQMANQIRSEL